MRVRVGFLCLCLAAGWAPPASTQTSLKDIVAGVDARSSELEQVDALLRDPDRNRRIAAMELLLKSGNPVFVARAREVGLFSADPELQRAALGAIFDAGGPFKLVVDLTKSPDDKNRIKAWFGSRLSWDVDSGKGIYLFTTKPFDETMKCWSFGDSPNCAFTIVGKSISIDGWPEGTGTFELGGDGNLAGYIRYTNGNNVPVPAVIPLVE